MQNGKYELISVEIDLNDRKIWQTWQNPLGGSILLSFDGVGEPNWPALPPEFPHAEARMLATDLANQALRS